MTSQETYMYKTKACYTSVLEQIKQEIDQLMSFKVQLLRFSYFWTELGWLFAFFKILNQAKLSLLFTLQAKLV